MNNTSTRTPLWRRWWMIGISGFVAMVLLLVIACSPAAAPAVEGPPAPEAAERATLAAVPTPTVAHMPTPTRLPVGLPTTDDPALWLFLGDRGNEVVISARSNVDIELRYLLIHLDDWRFQNGEAIVAGEGVKVINTIGPGVTHLEIRSVSAVVLTPKGGVEDELRCDLHSQSSGGSIYACTWR